MANLKARRLKISTGIERLQKLMEYADKEAKEKKYLNRVVDIYMTIQIAEGLIKEGKLSKNRDIRSIALELETDLSHFMKGYNPQRKDACVKSTKRSIEELSTRELLAYLKKNRLKFWRSYDENPSPDLSKVKGLLAGRDHVLKPGQSRLVRKMSIHAGKKLSLREAQLLEKRLKK